MIPKLHYISQGDRPEKHLENILKACLSGAELVQLRLKNFEPSVNFKTAETAREITSKYKTRLIINDYHEIAKSVNADGVHLGISDACPLAVRSYLHPWQCIGGTANTIEQCRELLDKGVDYIGLGPLKFTHTKQNLSPILGLEGYAMLLSLLDTDTPVIAIGGIVLEDIPELLETGVYGIAVSGELTKDFKKIELFHAALKAPEKQIKNMKSNQ